MRIAVPVPTPSSFFGTAQSIVRGAFAIPVATYEAIQALPAFADVIRGFADPEGPLRQIDDAILAVASLRDISVALNRVSDMANAVDRLADMSVALDRLADMSAALDRLADMSRALDRLAELQDELETLGNMEASLATIAELEKPVASLARTTESLPELASAAESLPHLVDEVQEVKAVVGHIGDRIDELTPALHAIAKFGVGLESEIDDLGAALAPISTIASKLPGGRRKAREVAREQAAGRSATAAPTPRDPPGGRPRTPLG